MVEFHPYGAIPDVVERKDYQTSVKIHPASNTAIIQGQPRDYKGGTILSALFCCLPLGIIGIFYSYRVRRFYQSGKIAESYRASLKTRNILQITMIFGTLIWFGAAVALVYFANHKRPVT